MYGTWKDNWLEVRETYRKWWNREGLIVANWGSGIPLPQPLREAADPGPAASLDQKYMDPSWIAQSEHYKQACLATPLICFPSPFPISGRFLSHRCSGRHPVSDPIISGTLMMRVFRRRVIESFPSVRMLSGGRLSANQRKAVKSQAAGQYFTGLPAVCPNLDVLAEIRERRDLMMDLILSPDWVKAKLEEIEDAFEEVYPRLYDIIKEEDGSSSWVLHALGSGTVCLAQCDTAAMISLDMYEGVCHTSPPTAV